MRLRKANETEECHPVLNPGMEETGTVPQMVQWSPFLFRRAFLLAIAGYLLLTVSMFGDVLWSAKDLVISNGGCDGFGQFLSWRKFGFDQMRQGHLPLWNPYVFCGASYFGGFQSALLYPLNVLFLFLPVTTAINYSIALHVFLAGMFVYSWASYRQLHPLACFLAGVIWMFSGPYFFHIYAGHLPNLCTMIWAPLLLLAIDGILDKPSVGWTLFGIFALSMQILAGHPQYVFYTTIIGGIYLLLRLTESPHKIKTVACLSGVYGGAICLTAVQLFAGAEATAQSIRSVGLSTGFAGSFSFPPENFLTLIAPTFFGTIKAVPYWGRWLVWEMSLFCGVTGIVLAAHAALGGYSKQRSILLFVVLLSCILALGANTKLFEMLYNYAPGFNKFRSNSKFIALTAVFISLLAGMGFDDLIRRRKPLRPLIYATAAMALLLVVAGFFVRQSAVNPTGLWRNFTSMIATTEQSTISLASFAEPGFVREMGIHAAKSLFMAAGVVITVVLALLLLQRSRRWIFVLFVVGVTEMFVFARSTRDTFDAAEKLAEPKRYFAEAGGEGRFNFSTARNLPMYFGRQDIWGNDPGIPLRYAQLMASLQGVNEEFAAEFDVVKVHPFFRALGCRFLVTEAKGKLTLLQRTNALPRIFLVRNYRVLGQKNSIFRAIKDRAFVPENEVILETEPQPKPDASGKAGTVRVVNSSTDSLEVEAEVPAASVLVVADSYTPGWRASALPGSSQMRYDLIPGDYCLRAVPLGAGYHKLLIHYVSPAFNIGKWISMAALVSFIVMVVCQVRNKRLSIVNAGHPSND